MPLTPTDVHNVAFSKPPIGKRGYHEDEVDAFLDLVQAELTRLIQTTRTSATRSSNSINSCAPPRSTPRPSIAHWSRPGR